MFFKSILLFLSTYFGGLIVLCIPNTNYASTVKLLLIFSGGYLFASTLLHLLPELFTTPCAITSHYIGLYILIGFFLQRFIECFSRGIEHGHNMHVKNDTTINNPKITSLPFVMSISLHAFLDGTILCNSVNHNINGLFLGIMLHKFLEGLTLTNMLTQFVDKKYFIIIYLLFFSLASPTGLWLNYYCHEQFLLSLHTRLIFFAIVSGNFLYISTMILFESSPEHHPNIRKFTASLIGSGIAVLLELIW